MSYINEIKYISKQFFHFQELPSIMWAFDTFYAVIFLLVESKLFITPCIIKIKVVAQCGLHCICLYPVPTGRAWLYLALTDHLLESYLRCFTSNSRLVKKYYVKEALVLDQQVRYNTWSGINPTFISNCDVYCSLFVFVYFYFIFIFFRFLTDLA